MLLVVHAALAVRKFPINYRQFRTYRDHMKLMRHEDTTLWYWQVVTGFALFFLAAPHLFQMLTQPGMIGPFESGDRVWSYRWWPLYIVLLFAVEIHGGVGLYRLAVKWGWFAGSDSRRDAQRLKILKWALTAFFLALGLATLAAYVKIGIEHADKVRRALHARVGPAGRSQAGGREMKVVYTDVLVIGGGLAGLRMAIAAKRRGYDAVILSLVPPKRSHSKAAQGGMQASLGNVIKGQGDNEDIHFEDTVRGSDWGADQDVVRMFVNTAPKAVRELAAWGVPWSRVPRGRPHGDHQRPEGDDHRARRGARARRAARLRRHQEMAHLLRLRRHRPRDAAGRRRPGDRQRHSRARARRGAGADPRRRPLLRRRRARPDRRRADWPTSPRPPRSPPAARDDCTA